MVKSSINGPFSMAMLNNQRVNLNDLLIPRKHFSLIDVDITKWCGCNCFGIPHTYTVNVYNTPQVWIQYPKLLSFWWISMPLVSNTAMFETPACVRGVLQDHCSGYTTTFFLLWLQVKDKSIYTACLTLTARVKRKINRTAVQVAVAPPASVLTFKGHAPN